MTMIWTDCMLGKAAPQVKPEVRQELYTLLCGLGFECFDVPYSSIESLSEIGVDAKRLRIKCADMAQVLDCRDHGWRKVRASAMLCREIASSGFEQDLLMYCDIQGANDLCQGLQPFSAEGVWRPCSIILVDHSGWMDPWNVSDEMTMCRKLAPDVPLEFQGNSCNHMGTAAALGAMRAGAQSLICAVGGFGDAVAWEEALLVGNEWKEEQGELPQKLTYVVNQIMEELGEPLILHKAVVGRNVFAHESGIHVHGVLRNPELYEPYPPERVGQHRRIVIGASSGRTAIQYLAAILGNDVRGNDLFQIAEDVKKMSRAQGHGLELSQLRSILATNGRTRMEG